MFDRGLLEVMRWAAVHYVAPLSVLLGKGAPPNLPRRRPEVALPAVPEAGARHPLAEAAVLEEVPPQAP